MPEVKIEYKSPKTLKILKALGKYFDFEVLVGKSKEQRQSINGIKIVPGNKKANNKKLQKGFTGEDLDVGQLGKEQ